MRRLVILLGIAALTGCPQATQDATPGSARPAPAPALPAPAAASSTETVARPAPAAPGAPPAPGIAPPPTPAEWAGSWLFEKMALQLAIVNHDGALTVAATSTVAKEPKPPVPCLPVVVTDELACTIHSPTTGKEMNIHLRRAGADPARVDFLTLLVGDYPVEVGSRVGLEGEPESEP